MSDRKISILLIGTGSLLNYGCEAIVQGTYCILKQYLPDCQIYLASDDFSYDSNLLPKDIKLVRYKKRFTLYRLYKGFLRRFFHIGHGSAVRMNTSIGKKYDVVLSCGGDNFCEAPDGSLYNLLLDLKTIGDNCIRWHKKYCLWGCSVGPFTNKNEQFIVDSLSRYTAIFVREKKSFNYLIQFPFVKDKLSLVADPAFCMSLKKVQIDRKDGDIYIGLNINSLAISYVVQKEQESDFCDSLFKQFDKLLSLNSRIKFLCIPHVMTDIGGRQDDYSFMQQYLNSTKFKDRVILLPKYLGAQRTKGYISQCDLLIAARMHCCVGGISTATPTLFLTYSNKGIGMAEYAYNCHDYDIPYNEIISDKFLIIINTMLEHREEIHHYLLKQQDRFNRDAMLAGNILSQILK